MSQLKYDNEFSEIIEDIEPWTNEEIPEDVINFINKKLDSKMICDEESDKYYCPICFSELTPHKYCNNCHKKYYGDTYGWINVISVNSINDEISPNNEYYYYVFDVNKGNVILYEIMDSVYLYRTNHLLKVSKKSINKVLLVKEDRLIDLINNKNYLYHDLNEEIGKQDFIINDDVAYIPANDNVPILDYFYEYRGYLYTDNLIKLKDFIYKYTSIWDSTKYLKKHSVCLHDITVLPLTNPSFEYLIKYKLYNLAYNPQELVYKNDFKDTFHVDKKYLNFMVKYDINYCELIVLSLIKKEDIKLIRKLSFHFGQLGYLSSTYNININKIIDYFKNKRYHYEHFNEYIDYIDMCSVLRYNLKNKKTLFPDNLIKEHNKVFNQYELVTNPTIEENIIKVSKVLEINKYEDDNYVIYPAPSLDSMIEESYNQNNCLKAYCEKYSKGETNIYFMRKKSNLNKSLVTIEVKNNKVIQARIKNNKLPSEELMHIINKWEKKLVPIEFENNDN